MKKAYTVIELLVILAIIAIFASVLFPCLSTARQFGNETVLLSHTAQLGKGLAAYASDYNETFPLAAVLRPHNCGSSNYHMGVGLEYPFPYNDDPYPQSLWSCPGRQNMAQAFWANAVLPYVKDPVDYSSPAATTITLSSNDGVPSWGATPLVDNLTFNGTMHHLNRSAIPSPASAVLAWPGSGNDQYLGRAGAEPQLNCFNTVDDCEFNPTGDPSSVPFFSPSSSGDSLFFIPNGEVSFWQFPSHTLPFLNVDGAVVRGPAGSAVEPRYVTEGGAFMDPFVQVGATGGLTSGGGLPLWDCNGPSTVFTGGSYAGTYWCFFRPDRAR